MRKQLGQNQPILDWSFVGDHQHLESFRRHTLCHLSAECVPVVKAGGLADMVWGLAQALHEVGRPNLVLLPFYESLREDFGEMQFSYQFPLVIESVIYSIHVYTVMVGGVLFVLLRFDDPDHSMESLYPKTSGGYASDIDVPGYVYYSKAALSFLEFFVIDSFALITHDWHTAGFYAYLAQSELRNRVQTLHVIHNYAHLGQVSDSTRLSLESSFRNEMEICERVYGSFRMGHLAVLHSKHLVTVSPNYADQLKQKKVRHRFLDVLESRSITGILNGIDSNVWNPEEDYLIPYSFSSTSVVRKLDNRAVLYQRLGWPGPCAQRPLVVWLSRLVRQKGIDLIANDSQSLDHLLQQMKDLLDLDLDIVVCGEVDSDDAGTAIQSTLQYFTRYFRNRFEFIPHYNEDTAHLLLAATDGFLMPSLFEPCGLTQMYAMRYGALPIVNPVGGLLDTVDSFDENYESGTGFYMADHSFPALYASVKDFRNLFSSRDKFVQAQVRAMKKNFSWKMSIDKYLALIQAE